MRTIKFRGKNSKGEWVIGDLLRNRGETFIAPDGIANPLATAEDFKVGPETIGQFTGLKDKNGKEIYEGDIIKWSDLTYKVVYSDSMFIGMGTGKRAGFYVLRHGAHRIVEIIGNIHDNSYLLKMI